jgi:hypothetical protein
LSSKVGLSAPDFKYNFFPVCYCGDDSGQQLIHVLEQHMEDIKNPLKEYLFRKYRDSWSALEQKLCQCPNRQEHHDNCEFKKTRNLVVDEYVHIPILGYNSGKYEQSDWSRFRKYQDLSDHVPLILHLWWNT